MLVTRSPILRGLPSPTVSRVKSFGLGRVSVRSRGYRLDGCVPHNLAQRDPSIAFLFGHNELDAMAWIFAPRILGCREGRSLELCGLASQPHLDERDQLSTTKP